MVTVKLLDTELRTLLHNTYAEGWIGADRHGAVINRGLRDFDCGLVRYVSPDFIRVNAKLNADKVIPPLLREPSRIEDHGNVRSEDPLPAP